MADVPMREWPPVAKQIRTVVCHIAIVAILVGLAFATQRSAIQFSSERVSSAVNDLVPQDRKRICDELPAAGGEQRTSGGASAVEIAKPLLPNLSAYPASDAEKQRIAAQALKVQRLQCLHMKLVDMYVRNYYGAVLVSMVFGGIAAITLFLVGPKGWSTSNQYLVNVLVTSGAIAAFFAAFPAVFQQPSMVVAHKAQVMRYEALLDGMASHTASPGLAPAACTGEGFRAMCRACDKSFVPADFIACTDVALSTADIPFALDPKSLPDYQKAWGGK
jgi:hypothetical protein